jgi:alanine dehydrogenase
MTANGHIFSNRKTLIVTMAEIKALMSMKDCIEIQAAAFCAASDGGAVNAPNTWLRVPGENRRWMKLLAGYVGDGTNAMGMKVLARFPKNPPGMNVGSIVALFDPENGFPLAIMDGVYFTAARTGAAGGLSCLYSARKNATRVGIVGSGVQARFNLMAIKELLPQVQQGRVFSRSMERCKEFAERVSRDCQVDLEPVTSVAEAVDSADIIITATNSPEPVLMKEHVQPGQHIVAVGIKTEIEPGILAEARVIADGKQMAMEDGKFSVAIELGILSSSDLKIELGDVISGRVPGRLDDEEITLFDSSGLAMQDVMCAHFIYKKACSQGIGTWADLGLGELP